MPNLEEEVAKLPDKEGWIQKHEFMKFAMTTELCKVEFVDRVFQKSDVEDDHSKKKEKREGRLKVKSNNKFNLTKKWKK